ncbi:uncharacterized protein PHACADRAFT_257964 [Phanerochaete carnosa HHB-10118-sp]|uniref:Altered inheritance of mitochondria protein 24, mitochondrial n=1 Tax=Phanerochaete carnosa (strain HHB-10118-sp) TaxID=650164 RepID=K5WUV6_PHACS|nr:uncharacterized protein PHACADRAFT_257964 [Phanerochaete carnosa HHB-10118-sp]EKM54247.1 hypothetical protein PHACADRAFT_257964 [Phanerochaete carnosa HHB-10118-sp]
MSHPGYPPPGQSPMPPQSSMPPQSPMPPQQGGSGARNVDTSVNHEGAQFRVSYRDNNSLLSVRLPPGMELKAKPGCMVAMDATVKIKGKMKVSFKRLITSSDLSESTFTGPGEVLMAPETWGDIVPIHLDGSTVWNFSKHAFLCCTQGVTRTYKTQSLGKTFFSGEGLFVEQCSGAGVIFVSSIGAIVQRHLQPNEQWIVDNGHLVAWTAKYSVERIQAGSLLSSAKTDEGLVCRFTGPGIVYLQTRNPEVLVHWISEQLPSSG